MKTKNLPASVMARLVRAAKENSEEAQSVLMRYGVERFLYRLSQSRHKDRFVLKGAALLSLWFDQPHRPTKDVDVLGFGENNISTLEKIIREICLIESDDGLAFDAESVHGEQIREAQVYQGIRLRLIAMLATARIPVQVDVGFGDAVTPAAKSTTLPTILDLPAASMKVYPKETVVAEKFEVMVKFGLANSRMKDFWDLDYMVREFDFDGSLLQKAIRATFANRQTDLPTVLPVSLTIDFTKDKRILSLWSGFIRRNRIDTSKELAVVVENLSEFFSPLIAAEASGNTFSGKWHDGDRWNYKSKNK